MADKKDQHYVPRFYMKRFSNESNLVDIMRVSDGEVIKEVNYRSQCKKAYFYGSDLKWENQLSQYEDRWSKVFIQIDNQKELDENEIKSIKEFALFQRLRTSGEFSHHYQERTELFKMYVQELCLMNGFDYDDEVKNVIKQNVDKSLSPSDLLDVINAIEKTIDDLSVVFIIYSTQNKLIISDVPIIMINPFHSPSIGLGCVGLVILFPVSVDTLAVIYDSNVYKTNAGFLYVESTNESEVETLNRLQYISADKIILGKTRDHFPELKKELIDIRSMNRDVNPVSRLGEGNNQLLVVDSRKTLLDEPLSFALINHSIGKIPFEFREGVQRKWTETWEQKLKNKSRIMSEIYPKSPELLNRFTIKEIRDGCSRFYREMIRYWIANGTREVINDIESSN